MYLSMDLQRIASFIFCLIPKKLSTGVGIGHFIHFLGGRTKIGGFCCCVGTAPTLMSGVFVCSGVPEIHCSLL